MKVGPRLRIDAVSRTVLALTGLVILAFAWACFVSYQDLRQARQASERQEAQRLLLAFEAHSMRLFDYADSFLRAIRAHYVEHGNGKDWQNFVQEIKAPHSELFSGIVTVIGRDGFIVYQSEIAEDKLKGFGKMSGLDHYQYFINHPGDSLFVGATRIGKLTGKQQFRLARPLLKNGKFDGLVVITLLPEHITDFYRSLSLGPHSTMAMITLEPKLIARQPPPAIEMYDRPIPDPETTFGIDVNLQPGGSVFGVSSPFDGMLRDVFFKRLVDYPVALVVSIAEKDLDQALIDPRRNLTLLALAFTAIMLTACILVLRMIGQNRRLIDADAASQELARQLRASEAFKLAVLDSVAAEIAVVGHDGTILAVNEPWRRFALENSESPGKPTPHSEVGANYLGVCKQVKGEAAKEAAEARAGIEAVLDGRLPCFSKEYECHSAQIKRWFNMMVMPLGEGAGDGVVVTHTNITTLKQAEEELRVAAAAFESQEGMVVTDANNVIQRVNRAFTELTGYTAEEIVGKTPNLLKSDRHDDEFYRVMWQHITQFGGWKGEIWDRRKSGEVYQKSLSISVVKDKDGVVTHYIGTQHDITERKQAEERIKELAYFDPLTGLPNRVTLHEKLSQVMNLARRHESQFALMLIDLDNFKVINDTLGHLTGDAMLTQVADRLGISVRQSDLVARLGGDEFVVVLPDIDGPGDAAHVAEKIVKEISVPYQIGGRELLTSPSIGICLYPSDATEREDLIKQADVAMYHAKSCGRGNYQFFSAEIQASAIKRLAIESDLRSALAKRQFLLHYQPQLDLRSGKLVGVEALIRWEHPERGLVSPMEFIPIAEESGLILRIGDWVLEESCRQLAEWRQGGIEHIRMSVNLAASQFADENFPIRVREILSNAGLPANSLDLEVTESMTMKSPAAAAAMMRVLAGQGLSLSIDDFGTGYSSLAYLKLFPITSLKIDRSFVKDIETNSNDADICDVTVLLAHKLGLTVVAEGVETEAQLKYLLSIGCEKIQGYLISKPLSAHHAETFMRKHRPLAHLGTVDLWGKG